MNLVAARLVGSEDLGNRSSPQFGQTRVSGRRAMPAGMLGQQRGGPKFLGRTEVLGFLAGQRHHPGARLRRDGGAAAPARQIVQRPRHAQLQGLAQTALDTGPVGAQLPGDLRNRVAGVIAQQHRSAPHAARRLASRLGQRGKHFALAVIQLQRGTAADKGQVASLLVMAYEEVTPLPVVLQHYFRIDLLAFDEFARQVVAVKPIPWGGVGPWTDHEDRAATDYLQRTYGLNLQIHVVAEAAQLVARENGFDPLLQYLARSSRQLQAELR